MTSVVKYQLKLSTEVFQSAL